MKLGLIFDISKSLLLARWKQTLIAAIGVTFSITMFITLLGFMTGLNNLLDGLMMNRTAHVRLYKETKKTEKQPLDISETYKSNYNFISSIKPKNDLLNIYNANVLMKSLKKDSRVLGVAPKVSAQVFYNSGAVSINGLINGVEVVSETELFVFNDYVTKGNYLDLKNTSNSIILGRGVAEKLSAELGDVVQVTNPKGKIIKLKVIGVFQTGVVEIDKVQSYCSIETTQKILGQSNSYITDIQIKLKNMNAAPAIANEYADLYGVDAIDIQAANAQFETGSSIRTLISYAVGITLLIVSGFGIYNILNMLIYEKMDSIAILKATGFSGKDVSRIFISVALTIGISGGALGLLFGFGLCNLIDQVPFNSDAIPTVKTYPIDYSLSYYLIAALFSVLTTFFAGFFPASKASKVDPVEIIRGK